MGLLDAFCDAANNAADRFVDNYKQKLRNASDDAVRRKWDEVNSNYDLDERIREATEDEMRRRGLY